MSDRPKILVVSERDQPAALIPPALLETCDIVEVTNPVRAIAQAARQDFQGVYITATAARQGIKIGNLLEKDRVLDGMPDGVALLDDHNAIMWANDRLQRWTGRYNIVGENFYAALGSPEIMGPDYCPFATALATGQASGSTLRLADSRFFHVHAAPVVEDGESQHLIVSVRDVTTEMLQQQKLAAIHKAGVDLADLSTDEVFNMEVEDRIELLKSNILHYTKDLLNFDVVEIRLLEKDGQLSSLLAYGLDPEAANRVLYARPEGNGVTGFVAATGKSYLCEDTSEDPLFLEGFAGSKSSLTVPLILHDEVIGTFNVESPKVRAFSEADLQFLEIFSRDVAVALNTLELLVAQKANAAQESVEAIHQAVALPVDEILNDAVHVMERYIGHEPEVVQRVQRILRNARDIKNVIQKVGEQMAPAEAVPTSAQVEDRPKLRGQRVLVVDADESVRIAAHTLLERYGCVVESAHDGAEAVIMVRSSLRDEAYDIILADIRLPDMSGHQLMLRLKEMVDPVPLILMTGFGYDPGHSIVKARQAGLHPQAILYKPFRLDQLLAGVEAVLDATQQRAAANVMALDLLLAGLALIGHLALFLTCFNRLHAVGMHRRPRRVLELMLVCFSAGAIVWYGWGWISGQSPFAAWHSGAPWLPTYANLCLVAAAATVPCWLWPKVVARQPSQLAACQSRTIDVGASMGTIPLSGQARLLSFFPGNEFLQLQISQKRLRIAQLPQELNGLTITHLSDLHFTGDIGQAYFDCVVDEANRLQSDVLIISGDIIESTACEPWLHQTLGRLQASLGKYYVLGNHDKRMPDVARVRQQLNSTGLEDLGARCLQVEWRGCRVLLAGNERPWFPAVSDDLLTQAVNLPGATPFRLLVSHSPDQVRWARRHGFELMLAGHNHGGQMRFPLLGPLVSPSLYGTRYSGGVYFESPTLLHVSRGISGEHPLRWNCLPELAQLKLERA